MRRAVVVGVDSYREFQPLKYVVDDAISVQIFLRGLRGEFRFTNVHLLRDPTDSCPQERCQVNSQG